MNTQQVINALRNLLGKHTGSELELLEALDTEAEGWRMRLRELADDTSDNGKD